LEHDLKSQSAVGCVYSHDEGREKVSKWDICRKTEVREMAEILPKRKRSKDRKKNGYD